jgi:hypothetical protein
VYIKYCIGVNGERGGQVAEGWDEKGRMVGRQPKTLFGCFKDLRTCGARSVPGKTALKISDAVERLFRAGIALDMTGISFHKLAR